MRIKEGRDIELRSEELQDVMGAVPHWILRWGMVTLFCVIMLLFIGSWFFKYPDTIQATMTLTGSTPSVALVAKTNGRLQHLYISNGQEIKSNEYLAILENAASAEDMIFLKRALEVLILKPDSALYFQCRDLTLGNVQSTYTSFFRSINNYKKFIELDYYPQKIVSVKNRIQQYRKYCISISDQQKFSEQQYNISTVQFKRDSLLKEKGVLSGEDMNIAQNRYLQSRLSLENTYSSLKDLQMNISQLEEDLLDIQQQYQDKKNSLESELITMSIQLMNEIRTWEMNYALISPIAGVVTFTNYWSENQYVTTGETVFTIIPEQHSNLIGKAQLPVMRSGKVKVGQTVNIHFINYPDEEFGMVRGVVKNISMVADKGNYVVEINLPNGLETTYHKELPFSPEMQANVGIITDDLRLLERFFMPLKKILKESF